MMDRYVAVVWTERGCTYQKAQFSGVRPPLRMALLYLLEERDDAGLYGVSDRDGGDWSWDEKIWLRPNGGDDYEPVSMRFRGEAPPEGSHYGMTYRDAIRAGYRPCGTSLQRGYVSRRANPDDQEVIVAGGTRHGQLYVLLNNPRSNQYCIRQYLRRDER